MNFSLTGSYTIDIPVQNMFLNENLKIRNHNIITILGQSFFLNRAINENFNPIKYICLGNGKNLADKHDLQLGNETIRKTCVKKVDIDKKQIVLTANFPSKDIIGTSEIGVHNGKVLISHDRYEKIDETFITPAVGDVTITYIFQFSTGAYRTSWKSSQLHQGMYYIVEPNEVVGVRENDLTSYRRVTNPGDLEAIEGSYYHDITSSSNLYVHMINENDDPNKKDMVVTIR